MVVIFFELLILFRLVSSLRRKGLHSITKHVWIALFIQAVILVIYRLEMSSLGLEVYYSDSMVYWNATLGLLRGERVTTWNMGYVYYSYLIQLTSPIVWAGFINISNIMLVNLTILTLASIMLDNGIAPRNVKTFVTICLSNPLVVYSLLRNLKDALFLFYVCLIILCFEWLSHKRRGKAFILLLIVILTILVSGVRPWGFLVSVMFFALYYTRVSARLFRNTPILFWVSCLGFVVVLGLVAVFMMRLGYVDTLALWVPIVFSNATEHGILDLLLAPFRILVGPGPFRAIAGHIYFLHYTISGNFFSAIGALLWWVALSGIVARVVNGRLKLSRLSMTLLMVWVLFLAIYSLQYGGSLELRFRGIIYILTSALSMSLYNSTISSRTRTIAVLAFGVLLVGGLIFG